MSFRLLPMFSYRYFDPKVRHSDISSEGYSVVLEALGTY